MGSEVSFAYDPGKRAAALREALPLRLRAATNGLRSHLDPEAWRAAHASRLGYSEMVFAADALLRYAYMAHAADLREAAAFLASQVSLCGEQNEADPANETSFITVPAFHRAAAAVRWAHEGVLPLEPLKTAARIRDDGRTRRGGLQTVIDDVPHSGGWQRSLALSFSADFVTRAVLGDWDWIDDVAQRGFLYLDALKAPSADGLLILFCRRLGGCARGEHTTRDVNDARTALNRCVASWADSVIAGQPWDASVVLLFFCVYAFERVVNDRVPSVQEVTGALLGETRSLTSKTVRRSLESPSGF